MRRLIVLLTMIGSGFFANGQKKALDHTVYDRWQSIGERMISNDGKWVIYTVNPQQGDNDLLIQSTDLKYKKIIPRGFNALITEDSRFLVFKIRALFKDTREAKIRKAKPEDFPKDSLALIELGNDSIWKKDRVSNYKIPEKGSGWLAYELEKNQTPKDSAKGKSDSAGELVLRRLGDGTEKKFASAAEYYFDKRGTKLLIKASPDPKDSLSKQKIYLYDLQKSRADTLSRGGNEFKNFAISEDGSQVAFVAERDAKPKELLKTFRLWYYKEGMDSAVFLADKYSGGMQLGMTVSENGDLSFSKRGNRLFFGTAPILPPKDTTLVEFEHAKLDIWHYDDEDLQTVQLFRLQNDLKRSYLAVYDFTDGMVKQLGTREIPEVVKTMDGDGDIFIGITDMGKRKESQWTGSSKKDIYAIDVRTGVRKIVKENLSGQVYPSSTGNYILWYDRKLKNYFCWDRYTIKNLSASVPVPLWNEEIEIPDDPNAYGVMKWEKNDSAVFIYDRYGVWKIKPEGKGTSQLLDGRKSKIVYRYVQVDPEQRSIAPGDALIFSTFNENNKHEGLWEFVYNGDETLLDPRPLQPDTNMNINSVLMAKTNTQYIFTKENFTHPADLYIGELPARGVPEPGSANLPKAGALVSQLSYINPQQAEYNWGTAELFKWKSYSGKMSEGLLYKPEDFDPHKKYPMICYFYERYADALNNYYAPAPIRSAVNIPFFVSRGYIIFIPDIHYGTGHPGRDAYNYVVSGARALAKKGFIDSTRMAIQGHSWGGYQVAAIITMTNLFKAAWAGAPVANMTSAYGGIRWESGLNRQFQYEKNQSRIGASLWEKQNLYIENSPLFHLDRVTTPLVIMANDADGAVPWYQGIELFTAMRRLGKKVWMFNYNGQGHGLTQRQDMLDYHIRMQQFFDWILKGARPAKWITSGVPAVRKGIDWGFEED